MQRHYLPPARSTVTFHTNSHALSTLVYIALRVVHTENAHVGVGRIFESVSLFVCLFVRSITQKQIIPKCSNLV